MVQEDRIEGLFDDTAMASVTNKDLRWMMLLMRTQILGEFGSLKDTVQRIEGNGKVLSEQVGINSKAVTKIERVQEECPISSREKLDKFVSDMVASRAKETAKEAALLAVREVPITKAILGGLTRPEIINMLVGAIVLLTGAVVFLATQGKVPLP